MDDGRWFERGAVMPLVAFVLAMVLVATWLLVGISDRAIDRTRAQSAADAAALAGVAEGESAASAVAQRNGAALTSFVREGDEVLVTVVVDGVEAVARAERRLTPP